MKQICRPSWQGGQLCRHICQEVNDR